MSPKLCSDPLPGQCAARVAEQGQVARADRPAGPGEQREQRGVGGDVLHQLQRRYDVGDLGQPEQALETDDLDRDVAIGERVEDQRRRARCRGSGPRSPSTALLRRAARAPARPATPAPRRRSRGRPPAPRRPPHRPSAGAGRARGRRRGRGQAVGDVEDAGVGATVDRQRSTTEPPRRRAGKTSAEVDDVGHRGAAPAVDRLVGVTDRHHRVAATERAGTSRVAWATEVSWYSSSSTTLNCSRSIRRRPGSPRRAGRRARSGRRSPSAPGRRFSAR